MIKLNPNLVVKQFYILLQTNNKYMMQLTQIQAMPQVLQLMQKT